jgi:outer membrane protein TolC
MFGIRLPVHKEHKQSQALHQAEAELEVARRQLDDRRLTTRAAVLELASQAERAEHLATLYDQGLIPQARAALESALASYAVGRIAFLDVLNDLTVLLESRIELASQQSERLRALAGLEPLVGMDLIPPSPVAPTGGSDAFTR